MMAPGSTLLSTIAGIVLLCNLTMQVSSFQLTSVGQCRHGSMLDMSVSFSADADESSEFEHPPSRLAEFQDLEPLAESETRQARMKEDKKLRRQFAKYGNDLWSLRKIVDDLSQKLVKAMDSGAGEKEQSIREKLRELEQQDPELVYKMELQKMGRAQTDEREEDAEKHIKNAMAARTQLPQYNLEGLWVGKYGQHGYELINVTYSRDSLIAYKVTGDKNVPQGEITFQVNLDPFPVRKVGNGGGGPTDSQLQPISLTEKAAKKWGTSQLPRYKGLGQVAEAGFNNNQWMDGQLIIIGEDYFSFAWVPIEQQIFFGRPSPELALKMLRENASSSSFSKKMNWDAPPSLDDDVEVLKEYVSSCLDKTSETVEDELQGDAFSCIWHGQDTEECYFQ